MFSLAVPNYSNFSQSEARAIVFSNYACAEPSRVVSRADREKLGQDEIRSFLLAPPLFYEKTLTQATHLWSSALTLKASPPLGNRNLSRAINFCLEDVVPGYAKIYRAVEEHGGAWAALAGIVTTLEGQTLLEQGLLATRLSLILPSESVAPFTQWFSHPAHIGVIQAITSPADDFLVQVGDTVSFLTDPEVRKDLREELNFSIEEETEPTHSSDTRSLEINLEAGELRSRALGLHQHLSLPDLSSYELAEVQTFYRASGFYWPLEDVIHRAWGTELTDETLGSAVDMLAYALAPWLHAALAVQSQESLAAFSEIGEIAQSRNFAEMVGRITTDIEGLRRN